MNHLAARLASSCSYHCQFRIQKTRTRQPPWHDLEKKAQNGSERSSIYVSIDLIHLLVASEEEEESSDKQIPGHGNPVQS
jgi:hypothetical protein